MQAKDDCWRIDALYKLQPNKVHSKEVQCKKVHHEEVLCTMRRCTMRRSTMRSCKSSCSDTKDADCCKKTTVGIL